MITYLKGDMFQADVDAVINTVNTDGFMGGGLAAIFRRKFPEMNEAYERECFSGRLVVGTIHVWDKTTPHILNVPTLGPLAEGCTLEIVEKGIQALTQLNYKRVAVPALGCGIGGLDWEDVKLLYEKYLRDSETMYLCFEPH